MWAAAAGGRKAERGMSSREEEITERGGSVSPKSKVKFLCSHGGKILPRPSDGQLKYVGGETRAISIYRNTTFSDLMKKLSDIVEGEFILKYQLIPEDLDLLISVKSDEDLRHMLDEYDRHESAGTHRFRAFLFPVNPDAIENQTGGIGTMEQRYIDAVNFIVRPFTLTGAGGGGSLMGMVKPIKVGQSSACSSPRSPESATADSMYPAEINYPNGRNRMPRVQSSPNLCSLSNLTQSSGGAAAAYAAPPLQQQQQQILYQNNSCKFLGGYYQLPNNKPPLDPHRGGMGLPERLLPVRSFGRSEQAPASQYQLYPATRFNRESCSSSGTWCTKYVRYDEHGGGYIAERRTESLPPSPSLARYVGVKAAWDNALSAE